MYFKALSTCMLHSKYSTLIFMLGSQHINYCRISCPACEAACKNFVCSLQHVEVTGREDALNN